MKQEIVLEKKPTIIGIDEVDFNKQQLGFFIYRRKSSNCASVFAMLTKLDNHKWGFVDMICTSTQPTYTSTTAKGCITKAAEADRTVTRYDTVQEFTRDQYETFMSYK